MADTVRLTSSDGFEFVISREAAYVSNTMKSMLDAQGGEARGRVASLAWFQQPGLTVLGGVRLTARCWARTMPACPGPAWECRALHQASPARLTAAARTPLRRRVPGV